MIAKIEHMSVGALYFGSAALAATIGALLLAWALFADRSRGRKRCPKCWYDMSAAALLRCPECGREMKSENQLLKTRRRWKVAFATLLPFALAGFLAVQPKVQRDGWTSLIPMTALLLGFQFSQDEALLDMLELRFSTEHYMPVTFRVPTEETMYRWQWRWLARRVLRLLEQDDLPAESRDKYVSWTSAIRDYVQDDVLRVRLIDVVVGFYTHDDPEVRGHSAMFSIDERDPEGTIERLAPLLSDAAPLVRSRAVLALRVLVHHSKSEAVVAKIIEFLGDPDEDVRVNAAAALQSAAKYADVRSPSARLALHAVFERTEGERTRFREMLVRALAEHYEEEADLASFLRSMLASDDPYVRGGVFDVLSMTAMDRRPFIDDAVRELQSSEAVQSARWSASWIIENCSCPDLLQAHEPALRQLARHNDTYVRTAAQAALYSMGIDLDWYEVHEGADSP